ncbi:MAG: hypothetical protein ACM3NR_00105 [Methanosarcina sp.]
MEVVNKEVMMEIKKMKPVFFIVLPLLALVIIRALGNDHFKADAVRWAEPSIKSRNVIDPANIQSVPGEKLIINLGNGSIPENLNNEAIKIDPATILEKQNMKLLRNRSILLWSVEPGVAARTWMLLSQLGYKNIFILESGNASENFKKEFRPDTMLIRPES